MKKRFLIPVLGIGALAGLYAIGIGSAKDAKEQAALHAQRCIELRGDSARCDKVVRSRLDDTTRVSFDQAMEQRKERQQAAEAKRQQQIADMHARADQAKLKAAEEIAKAEAKFKAEGWWQASNGIYVRWCTDENPCPGSASDHYTARVWRAMVWCKERACGDIYARMNIENGGAVIGWTNDTAYGDYGQKVLLTFGSHLSGQGRIVEFQARG